MQVRFRTDCFRFIELGIEAERPKGTDLLTTTSFTLSPHALLVYLWDLLLGTPLRYYDLPSPPLLHTLPRPHYVTSHTPSTIVTAVVLLGFVLALGFLLVILSCALWNNWLPLLVGECLDLLLLYLGCFSSLVFSPSFLRSLALDLRDVLVSGNSRQNQQSALRRRRKGILSLPKAYD